MGTIGYLGIDAGTQGLSVIITDEDLNVLATGEGHYDMVPGLAVRCYEQHPGDWMAALQTAMADLRNRLSEEHRPIEVACIGLSGQMHGEVLADADGNALATTRLWCDGRNAQEGIELTERFGVKIPKRMTAARWLWTLRHHPDRAAQTRHITTPAGWISHRLTGDWTLGIGDASGLFPIDQAIQNYDASLLDSFDQLVADQPVQPLRQLLPSVRRAGEDGGRLSAAGAEWLGLRPGTPIAAAEGDQPAALAGSLIGRAGIVSISFGTSVCANSVGDRAFQGVSSAIDHFCAADGKPINMVFLRNGTTFMNSAVEMFGTASGRNRGDGFASVMPLVLEANPDCGGLLALPFVDDEPGLGVHQGGTAMIIGLNDDNASAGNVVKAALLATVFNLRSGSELLDQQAFPRHEIVLSGGLTKTPQLGQIIADVFRCPVTLLDSAEEGTAWGAALLAKYRRLCIDKPLSDWSEFLVRHTPTNRVRFQPSRESADEYDEMYQRYRQLMQVQPALDQALGG